jgi:hypothetical protein
MHKKANQTLNMAETVLSGIRRCSDMMFSVKEQEGWSDYAYAGYPAAKDKDAICISTKYSTRKLLIQRLLNV